MNSKIYLTFLSLSGLILLVKSSFVTPDLACDVRKDLNKREDAVYCVIKNADKAGPQIGKIIRRCDAKYGLLKDKAETLRKLCEEHERGEGVIADCLVNAINPLFVDFKDCKKYTDEVAVDCFKDLQ